MKTETYSSIELYVNKLLHSIGSIDDAESFASIDTVSKELKHHGIKGQQWGVKNGPPYPLDKGTHAAVVAKSVEGTAGLHGGKIEKTSGLFSRKEPEEDQEHAKAVLTERYGKTSVKDPDKLMNGINPDLGTNNCVACTFALILRSRYGINVSAQDCPGQTHAECENNVFKYKEKTDAETYAADKSITKSITAFDRDACIKCIDSLEKQILEKHKEGECGAVRLVTADLQSGHFVAWFIEGGKVVLRDAQLQGLQQYFKSNPTLAAACGADDAFMKIKPTMRTTEEKADFFVGHYVPSVCQIMRLDDKPITSTSHQEGWTLQAAY